MARKIILENRTEPAFFTFIGISFQLMDYRLLFELNKRLEFNFTKEPDFPGMPFRTDNPTPHSFYSYKDDDQRLTFYLLANRGAENTLFPTLKQVDYIMIVEGFFRNPKKEAFLTALRKVPNVLMVFEINKTLLKNIETFLIDLELHVLHINKESKEKKVKQP